MNEPRATRPRAQCRYSRKGGVRWRSTPTPIMALMSETADNYLLDLGALIKEI